MGTLSIQWAHFQNLYWDGQSRSSGYRHQGAVWRGHMQTCDCLQLILHWFSKGHWTKSGGILIHHNLDEGGFWHLVEVEPRTPLAPDSAQDRQKALSGSKCP